MAYNNRLLNTSVFMLTDSTMDCALADMKTMNIIARKSYPITGYDRESIMNGIDSFCKETGIMNGLKLHFIVNEPVHDSFIYEDKLYEFSKYFTLRKKRNLSVSSIVDMLAYAQWNKLGLAMSSKKGMDRWAVDSRIALVYIDRNKISVSMVNDGDVIDGVGIIRTKTMMNALTSRIDASNPFLPADSAMKWKLAMEEIAGTVFETMHPDYIYYYLEPYTVPPMTLDTGIIKTEILKRDKPLMDDIVTAAVMKDSYFNGDHYYMKVSKGDYQDISVEVEDDKGNKQMFPVFQH